MVPLNFAMYHEIKLPSTAKDAALVGALMVSSFYGQMLITRALQVEEAGIVSIIRICGETFFAFVFDMAVFGKMPDTYTISGAVLVLFALGVLSFGKYITSLDEDE